MGTVRLTNETVRILMADSHTLFRECIVSLMQSQPHLDIVAQADDGSSMVQHARACQPDILLTNILIGVEGIRNVSKELPRAKIIVLSEHVNTLLVTDMLGAGVSGYVTKCMNFQTLLDAIHGVLAGETYLCSKTQKTIVDEHIRNCSQGAVKHSLQHITVEERNVLRLVAEGKNSKEIGRIMHKSAKTVDAYRRRLMHELGLGSVADIVKYALKNHLVAI